MTFLPQRRFYESYPESELDRQYKFACSSSMKPTRWDVPPGTINILPGECSISGDIRLSPFYSCKDVSAKVVMRTPSTATCCGPPRHPSSCATRPFPMPRHPTMPCGCTAAAVSQGYWLNPDVMSPCPVRS